MGKGTKQSSSVTENAIAAACRGINTSHLPLQAVLEESKNISNVHGAIATLIMILLKPVYLF